MRPEPSRAVLAVSQVQSWLDEIDTDGTMDAADMQELGARLHAWWERYGTGRGRMNG